MSSNFAETSSSLSHPFISSTDSKMKKSSLKHRTHGGIHNIFDIVFKRRPQSGLFILYLFFMIFNSTKAADDTLYLYDDDFYDSYYYDDDYNSALTKYFKEESTNSGQQKSGQRYLILQLYLYDDDSLIFKIYTHLTSYTLNVPSGLFVFTFITNIHA